MDVYEPQRKRRSKARERQAARKNRRHAMAVRIGGGGNDKPARSRDLNAAPKININLPGVDSAKLQDWVFELQLALQDGLWYLRSNPKVLRFAGAAVAVLVVMYFMGFWVRGRVFPNVEVLGVDLGGMSVEAAETALNAAWRQDILIDLYVDGEKIAETLPSTMGLQMDTFETAERARSARLGALPFGTDVTPSVEINQLTAQNYLLDIADEVNTPPYEAGYKWENGQVTGVRGEDGRMLDVALTIQQLENDAQMILERGRVELLTIAIPPAVADPTPFLDDVQALVGQDLALRGYDPYTNEHYTWAIEPERFASWLAAAPASLTLRQDQFEEFIYEINDSLNQGDNGEERYIAEDEATTMVSDVLATGSMDIDLRVRYHATQYTIASGDTGHSIARKVGIPFYLIDQANSGIAWEALSIGQTINLPTRDVTMPETPLADKRIVVDLNRQYLTAYENGQVVFEWLISSGRSGAPTSPGIYQILSHEEVAYGSSNTLCDSAGVVCGIWEMNWFMGIYEVVPGLVNGFHGAVLLPNGNWLDGGHGSPSTFGCVMSNDDLAKQLYDWAEVGTVVEIIGDDFTPMSDLAAQSQNNI